MAGGRNGTKNSIRARKQKENTENGYKTKQIRKRKIFVENQPAPEKVTNYQQRNKKTKLELDKAPLGKDSCDRSKRIERDGDSGNGLKVGGQLQQVLKSSSRNLSCSTQSNFSKVRQWDCFERGTRSQFLDEEAEGSNTFLSDDALPHSAQRSSTDKRICNWIDDNEKSRKMDKLKMEKVVLKEVTLDAKALVPSGVVPRSSQPGHTQLSTREIDYLYSQLDSHVDDVLRKTVATGRYVELNRLFKRNRDYEDREVYQLVNRGGRACFVPVDDFYLPSIDSYDRWVDAFQIFATIYSKANPERAWELFQYMDSIRTAARGYRWENVCEYDVTFRRHMERYPQTKWGPMLFPAWTLILKDPIPRESSSQDSDSDSDSNSNPQNTPTHTPCRYYNYRGCCRGEDCWYAHKCSCCGRSDHGENSCPEKDKNGCMD